MIKKECRYFYFLPENFANHVFEFLYLFPYIAVIFRKTVGVLLFNQLQFCKGTDMNLGLENRQGKLLLAFHSDYPMRVAQFTTHGESHPQNNHKLQVFLSKEN
jgi:hypothetical protein